MVYCFLGGLISTHRMGSFPNISLYLLFYCGHSDFELSHDRQNVIRVYVVEVSRIELRLLPALSVPKINIKVLQTL